MAFDFIVARGVSLVEFAPLAERDGRATNEEDLDLESLLDQAGLSASFGKWSGLAIK